MKTVDTPQQTEHQVIERAFVTVEGYYGVCVFNRTGHRCGYVGIPEGHVLYESHYDNVDYSLVDVHGGLTYSGWMGYDEGLWFLGFDCGHVRDRQDIDAMEKWGYADLATGFDYYSSEAVVRSLEYVIEEVKSLSNQLTPESIMQKRMEQG